MSAPQFGVGDVVDTLPDLMRHRLFHEAGTEVAVEEVGHIVAEEGADVGSVGNGADGDFRLGHTRPDIFPHTAGDRAVKLRDPIAMGRRFEGQHRHAKAFVRILRVFASQSQECLARQAEVLRISRQIVADQVRVESFVSRGHRGMRGEYGGCPDQLARGLVGQFIRLHQVTYALQRQKSGVPLVHMADRGFDPENLQCPNAANAEQHFLPDAHILVAPIELGGDHAVVRRVFRDIGIQQIERHAPHLHAPDLSGHIMSGHFHDDPKGIAPGVALEVHGHIIPVVFGIEFLLPSVPVQILLEIALAIEQAHGDQRNSEIAGGFKVISGENAQSAGVNGQALVHAVFG